MRKAAGKGRWEPEVAPGNWRGEILGSCTLNLGQVVQPGPPRQSVEFSYLIMPAAFTGPDKHFAWPGVIMLMVPTPMKTEMPDAGLLFKADGLPSLHLSLEVTRGQFSDMVPLLQARRLRELSFKLENKIEDAWPVYSWSVSTTFPESDDPSKS